MKWKIILSGDYYENKEEMHNIVNLNKYPIFLEDVENYLRQLDKYDDRDSIPIEELVEKYYQMKKDNEL